MRLPTIIYRYQAFRLVSMNDGGCGRRNTAGAEDEVTLAFRLGTTNDRTFKAEPHLTTGSERLLYGEMIPG